MGIHFTHFQMVAGWGALIFPELHLHQHPAPLSLVFPLGPSAPLPSVCLVQGSFTSCSRTNHVTQPNPISASHSLRLAISLKLAHDWRGKNQSEFKDFCRSWGESLALSRCTQNCNKIELELLVCFSYPLLCNK